MRHKLSKHIILASSAFLFCSNALASSVTYYFDMLRSDNGASATGHMTFASPPASSNLSWTSFNSADLQDWSFTVNTQSQGVQSFSGSNFNHNFYNFTYNNPRSFTGQMLDDGSFDWDSPLVADDLEMEFNFSNTNGLDHVSIYFFGLPGSAVGSYYGDWATRPVPVPAAAWLMISGLIGLIGFTRRG